MRDDVTQNVRDDKASVTQPNPQQTISDSIKHNSCLQIIVHILAEVNDHVLLDYVHKTREPRACAGLHSTSLDPDH